jgi:hypothetical protein
MAQGFGRMKATLEFDLPEDNCEFRLASRGMDWALVVHEIVNVRLRAWLKYGHEFKTADEALEAVRDLVFSEIEARGVSLDDIV